MNNHWSKIGEVGTVFGMRFVIAVYRLFGRKAFKLLLYPVVAFYYLFNARAREASQDYLMRIKRYQPDRPGLSTFRHMYVFGEVVMDKFLVWMQHIDLEDVGFESDGAFARTISQGRGGIIVVSHLGNTEICSALSKQHLNLRLTILVYTQHAEKFESLMQQVGGNPQMEVYQVTEITPALAMVMSDRVAAGEFIVIAGDRTPVTGPQRVSYANFLGEQAAMPQGAFILAALLKCPVFLMFCLKQQQRYSVHMELFAEQLHWSRKHRQEEMQKIVQQYANRLEVYCLSAPLQWFNFYPFWQQHTMQYRHVIEKTS